MSIESIEKILLYSSRVLVWIHKKGNEYFYYTGRHQVRTLVIISWTLVIIPRILVIIPLTLVIIPRILVIIPLTLVIIPRILVTYLGHSSLISDIRHLSRTLVTYLGHSSPISDKFVYNTGKVECAFDF